MILAHMIPLMEQFFADLGTLESWWLYRDPAAVFEHLRHLDHRTLFLLLTVNGRAVPRRLSEMNSALRKGQQASSAAHR